MDKIKKTCEFSSLESIDDESNVKEEEIDENDVWEIELGFR